MRHMTAIQFHYFLRPGIGLQRGVAGSSYTEASFIFGSGERFTLVDFV